MKTPFETEIEVSNFSSTWADGLALCALLHSRLPLNVPYRTLVVEFNKRKNVETALKACQVLGIASNNLPSGNLTRTPPPPPLFNLSRVQWMTFYCLSDPIGSAL